MKLNTKKFMRNIIICIIAWLVVSMILNYAPGFKRDKFAHLTKLVINDEDRTEELKYEIYVDDNKNIYLSIVDISNLFDKNIYKDANTNTIITTSNTKVASMKIGEETVVINEVSKNLKSKPFEEDGMVFIPISDLTLVYNITVNYSQESNVLMIDELNKGLIQASLEEETTIKYKPRLISKNLGKIEKGSTVNCYYTTSKGWRLIRTEDGRLGYVKANVLSDEDIVRQDWNDKIQTKELTMNLEDGSQITLYNDNQTSTKITVKTLFNFEEDGKVGLNQSNNINENDVIWATILNNGFEKQTNEYMRDFGSRTQLINTIINFISKYKVRGINIDFKKIDNSSSYERFIIELAPRLREIGITTNVVVNNDFNEENVVEVVDYIITRKEK